MGKTPTLESIARDAWRLGSSLFGVVCWAEGLKQPQPRARRILRDPVGGLAQVGFDGAEVLRRGPFAWDGGGGACEGEGGECDGVNVCLRVVVSVGRAQRVGEGARRTRACALVVHVLRKSIRDKSAVGVGRRVRARAGGVGDGALARWRCTRFPSTWGWVGD